MLRGMLRETEHAFGEAAAAASLFDKCSRFEDPVFGLKTP